MLHQEINFYIDESYKEGGFVGVAIVAVVGSDNLKIVRDILGSASNSAAFRHRNKESNEIHFADNNFGPRLSIAENIYKLPVSAYLSYVLRDISKLDKQERDAVAYGELLPELLKRISTKYKKKFNDRGISINLFFEQLTDKKAKDLTFFKKCIEDLKFDFNVEVVGKDNAAISLPDYFLGLLGNFLLPPEKAGNYPRVELELVENKIGLIIGRDDSLKAYHGRGEEIRDFIESHSK